MDRYDITIQMLGVEASGPQYVWEKVPAEEGELVLYTDAQATIAALQAVIDDHHRLVREMDVRLNGEQGAAKQASLCDIVSQLVALQARVQELEDGTSALLNQQSERLAVENEKLTMALFQLTQRTAELEAAKADKAKWEDIAGLRFAGDHKFVKEMELLKVENANLQAELERVRSLIKALPKVEGELTCSQQFDSAWRLQYWQVEAYGVADECLYRLSNLRKEEANAYAALLQHRQGMEG